MRRSYGFHSILVSTVEKYHTNNRNWLYKGHGPQQRHFTNIFQGFIGAKLFFLARTRYYRIHLAQLDEMGRMAIPIPKRFTTFNILSVTFFALPGMSGFVAELIIFVRNNYQPNFVLIPKIQVTFVIAIGMILTPIYSLSTLCQTFSETLT